MTFTMQVKEEISKTNIDNIGVLALLSSFIKFNGNIKNDKIMLTMENASCARLIYKLIKNTFMISPKIIIRMQRRFRVKQIYILEINDKVMEILDKLNIMKDDKIIIPEEYFLSNEDEKINYLKGLFLACGSINNPSTSGYHLEFVVSLKKDAIYISKLIKSFNIESKVLRRNNKYMIYIKQAEMISDILKMFQAINSMFYFEDIRIYRDHKNMVNRLNNCEIANQEKSIVTGMKQLEDIKYLEDNDLISLLDDKVNLVITYRKKYPETSFQELADIISSETDVSMSKSKINHYFRKVKELVNKNKNKAL